MWLDLILSPDWGYVGLVQAIFSIALTMELWYVCCSSQFALRSYLYLLFHEIVARPALWLFGDDKVRFQMYSLIDFCYRSVFLLFMLLILPLSFTVVGESVLCCEILSWFSVRCHRDCFCGSYFKKVWKTTCLLYTCYAVLSQRLFLC